MGKQQADSELASLAASERHLKEQLLAVTADL